MKKRQRWTGVFSRRTSQYKHECPVCKKKYKHQSRYHTHLRTTKCQFAIQSEPVAPAPKVDPLIAILQRVDILEASSREKDERIDKLTKDIGNLKRSLYHLRSKQETANAAIIEGQAALKIETRKLYTKKFGFEMQQSQSNPQPPHQT